MDLSPQSPPSPSSSASTAPPSPTSSTSSSLSSPPSPLPLDDSHNDIKTPSPLPPTDAQKASAEEEKKLGNDFFRDNRFHSAITHYEKAIQLDPTNPSYYSNIAFCHFKLEEYGAAIEMSGKCLALDNRFIKGNYRRGDSYLAMGKYKEARKDFQQVLKYKAEDKDAKTKLMECEKKIREEIFKKAIENEHTKNASEIAIESVQQIEVESTYDGPKLLDGKRVTKDFMNDMMKRFKEQKKIHRKYVYEILLQSIEILKKLPSVVEIPIAGCQNNNGSHHTNSTVELKEITVCGDTHGQYYDVCNIFSLNGLPSEDNPYLFNGDFVDRGSFSYEVIMTFLGYKVLYPNHFFLSRGNHESHNMNSIYGFQGEIQQKVDNSLAYDLFTECFNWLPLGNIIGGKIFVVHGGLFSEDGVKVEDLKKLERNQQPPESGRMCEMLWADPQEFRGRAPSKRGVGFSFGPDVTSKFLTDNNLSMIIRSHEVKDEGYEIMHDGKLVTVFSAPNYCDSMGNKGAFIKIDGTLVPKYTKFDSVSHPDVKPMAYSSGMYRGGF